MEKCSMTGCEKESVMVCPDCDFDWCDEHSRDDGKCIYCTSDIVIDEEQVKHVESLIAR